MDSGKGARIVSVTDEFCFAGMTSKRLASSCGQSFAYDAQLFIVHA
jgi:hypothetical protein